MKRNGLAQIPLMIGLLLMAIAVPVATKLVQTNQDIQNKAAFTEPVGCWDCATGCCSNPTTYGGEGCKICPTNPTATKTPTKIPTKTPTTSYCNVALISTSGCGGGNCAATEVQQTWKTVTCSTTTKCVASDSCKTAVCTSGQYKCIGTVSTACLSGQWNGVKQNCTSGCDTASGKCKPAPTPTTGTENCEGSAMNDPSCNWKPVGFGCNVNSKCVDKGTYCKCVPNTLPTVCQATNKPTGCACSSDGQCNSGNCMQYAGQPKVCVVKLANGENCNVDSNCDSGNCTILGSSVKKCQAKLDEGKKCLVDSNCKNGSCEGYEGNKVCRITTGCTDGPYKCMIVGTGAGLYWCNSGSYVLQSVCPNGCNTGGTGCLGTPLPTVCQGTTNKPTGCACSSDGQCNSGNCMQYAGQPKVCVVKLANGENCNVDSNCASGVCNSGKCGGLRNDCNAGDTCVSDSGTCSGTKYGRGLCNVSKYQVGSCCTKTVVPTPVGKCSTAGGRCYTIDLFDTYDCTNRFVGNYSDCYRSAPEVYYTCCKTLTPKGATLTPTKKLSPTPTIPTVAKCPVGSITVMNSNICGREQTLVAKISGGVCCKNVRPSLTPTVTPKVTVTPKATATPTIGKLKCYCYMGCNTGNCKWLTSPSGDYKYSCTDSTCSEIPKPTIKPTVTITPKPTIPLTCSCIGGKWTGNNCGAGNVGRPCGNVTPPATCDPAKYKGEKNGNVWLHFDDAYTAKCICGGTDYHYVCASGYWACGDGRKDTKCPACVEACPNRSEKNLLQSCSPPDSDGTSLDTLCNKAGITGSCGGKTYCCPTKGGAWTSDMSKCIGTGTCTQCAGKPEAKGKGDADCSGTTSINDASIWRSEFIEGELGTVTNTGWQADFDCNGKVNLNDISIWRDNFIKGL